jgi:DNA-directed RNA polymerase specialized sigma24 family protein
MKVLDAFSIQYPVQAELVKLRYFVGMTNEEASQVLGISLSTLNNYWNFSRALLFKQIRRK